MKNLRIELILPAVAALALWPLAATQNPAHAASSAPDISGVYWASVYSPQIQPVGGGMPPYKPEALAQYKKNMAGLKLDDDMSRSYCLPDGVPRALEDPYPFEIVQVPERGEVYQLFEINHMIRRVDMHRSGPSNGPGGTPPWTPPRPVRSACSRRTARQLRPATPPSWPR